MNAVVANLGRGALGMAFLIAVCYILSTNRKAVNWKLVLFGVLAQVMFAMGVLHTTFMGQPVFWMLFGLVLLYTIGRKALKAKSGATSLSYDGLNIGLSLLWQTLLVAGLILAPRLFGNWANLVMTLSVITILITAFKMGACHPELMKWNILLSSAILTLCVYSKVCPPEIFRIILQSVSSVFVSLINVSHKGTEFIFGNLADPSQSWAYVFAIQVLPNIIFFAALSAILFYLGSCITLLAFIFPKEMYATNSFSIVFSPKS